jgi:hypothetical protein
MYDLRDPFWLRLWSPAQTNNLTSCTACFNPNVHGRAYAKFIVGSSCEILSRLHGLIQAFLSSSEHEAHLPAVATLNGSIDAVRTELDVMPDNAAAVRRRWAQNCESLEDALSELSDLINGEGGNEGWNDFEIECLASEPSPQEMEISRKVRTNCIS